ncbi:MAG: patatin-like phospholipase family protein [Bacteroidales bacterium]|nr:patatin-like phospholipase family protein [Bacteroidales bacterium]
MWGHTARILFPLAFLPLILAGCRFYNHSQAPIPPTDLASVDSPCDSLSPLTADELNLVADQIRESRRPPATPARKYNILALSGGGAYGAYTAGVLCGWTETGTRPEFDVITGISTGSLIACLAFLGPCTDEEIHRFYTQTKSRDLYRIHKPIRSLFSAYLADNTPLADRISATITPQFLAAVAGEHAKGRRLYVGTTNLNTRRLVVWDMGAIAARGTPESRELFINVLLASTAIPGFFPPVRFSVDVDGKPCEEIHVDGGVSRAVFFRAPFAPPESRAAFGATSLHDSNLYLIVAGKLYPDPAPVRMKALNIAGNSISSLIHSSARAEVYRLFTYSILTGMNYHLAAVPQEFATITSSVKFDPIEMTKLFEEGRRQIHNGTAWRKHPQGLEKSEDIRARTGLHLTVPPPDGCKPGTVPVVPLEMPREMPRELPAVEPTFPGLNLMPPLFPSLWYIPDQFGMPLPLSPSYPLRGNSPIPPGRAPIAK